MKVSRKYLVVSAVIVLGGVTAVLSLSGRKAEADADAAAPTAAVARAERHRLDSTITLSGEFRPFQEVDVHAKVAGYIRSIQVDVGDKVKEGQTLAVLEVPELQAQMEGAEASIRRDRDAIRRAESNVQRSESAHGAAHAAYTRLKQASEQRSGLIAEQELDDSMAKDKESEANVGSAQAALAEARNQLNIAEANRQQLAAMQAYTHIAAPFSGVITKRYADTGSLIQAGTASSTQAMPVVRLAETDKLRLILPVPESAVPLVHLGNTVQVRVPALGRTFEGRVARYADALDPQTRTMHTEVDVPNKESLVLGMYAEVNLVLETKPSALSVPVQAVSRNGEESSVLLVSADNRIEERKVQRLEIVSGLKEGDQVVIGSRSQFRSGERVVPKVVRASKEGGF
jgi:RND family efflux transporter MFP subunit